MNITEFVNTYGILLIVGEIINYKNDIPVRYELMGALLFIGFIFILAWKFLTLNDQSKEPFIEFLGIFCFLSFYSYNFYYFHYQCFKN